jgi:hypothetical protein
MPPNDLAAPDPVGIVQDNIDRFNLGVGGQKRFCLGYIRARGTGV